MNTATVTQTDADVLQALSDLQRQADEEQTRHRTTMNELLANIRDTANGACGDFQVESNGAEPSSPETPTQPAPARTPARSRRGAKKKAKATTGRRNGAKKTAKKKKGKVSAKDRNYDNKMTLAEAIWDILDRDDWPDLKTVPADAVGLNAGEIKLLLDKGGNWQSASADPGNQISAQLGKFKEAGKIERGDERRYYIVKGAKLKD